MDSERRRRFTRADAWPSTSQYGFGPVYEGQLELAISTLQAVAAVDFEDFFSFDVDPGPTTDPGRARKLVITAFLGNKEFQRFKIDLVVSSNMTQQPDIIAPLSPVKIPGLPVYPYRVYAVVDHLADKIAAMVEQHNGQPSSRYRDLVDIVLLANTHTGSLPKT